VTAQGVTSSVCIVSLGAEIVTVDPGANGGHGTPVTIAIPTRDRVELLGLLLRSIRAHAVFEPGTYLHEILVVDNDPAGSAELAVRSLRAELGLAIRYVAHPTPGVAQARSRALAEVDDGVLVFVDDDEVVDAASDWPAGLLRTMHETDADLVAGLVTRRIDPEDRSAVAQLLRVTAPYRHGEPMTAASTGNLAMEVGAIRRAGLTFDTRFDHVGGEDSAFTAAAVRAGLNLRWSDAGVLSEHTPADRLTERWLTTRARQGTFTWLKVHGADRPALLQVGNAAVRAGGFALRSVTNVIAGVLTRSDVRRLRGRLDRARAAGAIDALRGHTVETYGRANGG
jgi:succinoglycan biosynthesis protein ExoM